MSPRRTSSNDDDGDNEVPVYHTQYKAQLVEYYVGIDR